MLRACKQKKRRKKDTACTCIYIYIKTEEKLKEEDELVTTCINANAQDVNLYTHQKCFKKIKKKKLGKSTIHVQEIVSM